MSPVIKNIPSSKYQLVVPSEGFIFLLEFRQRIEVRMMFKIRDTTKDAIPPCTNAGSGCFSMKIQNIFADLAIKQR